MTLTVISFYFQAVIAAAMTDKPPFVVPLSKKSEADTAKQALSLANSDHVTLLKAFVGLVTLHDHSE